MCKEGADPTSFAGGGLATDIVKVTVVGAFHEGDPRDPHTGKVKAKKVPKAGAASITFVVGSEGLGNMATIKSEGS